MAPLHEVVTKPGANSFDVCKKLCKYLQQFFQIGLFGKLQKGLIVWPIRYVLGYLFFKISTSACKLSGYVNNHLGRLSLLHSVGQ